MGAVPENSWGLAGLERSGIAQEDPVSVRV